jgi:NAD(P)-dependent dehydrogenase (short-subunit alcohol dehydrogenase family)
LSDNTTAWRTRCPGRIGLDHHGSGRVDILINSAGITYRERPEALSALEWNEVLDVNLSGSGAAVPADGGYSAQG